MLRLPPNPPHVHPLDTDDVAVLRSLNKSLPRSPAECKTCGGRPDYLDGEFGTFKWYDDKGQVADYQCHCIEQYQLLMWLTNAGIGLRYQRYTWVDAESVPFEAQSAALKYADDHERLLRSGMGLIIYGEMRGTGKTLLATLLLKHLIAQGVDGYFTTMSDMLDAYTAGWRDEEARHWFERRVRNAGILVVDDIGREYRGRSDVGEHMLEAVLRDRNNECKPTIVTTNLNLAKMEQGYGEHVISLLSEGCMEIEVVGTDYRKKAQATNLSEQQQGLSRPVVLG